MDGTGTVGGEFTLVSGSDASTPLAFNASAAEVAEATNSMKEWAGLVLVERQELRYNESSDSEDMNERDMFEWRLTFSPAEGNVDELRVRKPCDSPQRGQIIFLVTHGRQRNHGCKRATRALTRCRSLGVIIAHERLALRWCRFNNDAFEQNRLRCSSMSSLVRHMLLSCRLRTQTENAICSELLLRNLT